MKINRYLTADCPLCGGIGNITSTRPWVQEVSCANCFGTGKVPDAEGREILELVRRIIKL